MLKELIENYSEETRQDTIEKLKELLKNGECVYSYLLGRVGKVISYDEKNDWLEFKRKGKRAGVTHIQSGDPIYLKQDEDGCWILTNQID